MSHTKWKQDFFNKVEPITMRDKLAETLGAVDTKEVIHYSFTDCIKVAGHACASVASAFQMTKLALKELYGDEVPARGEMSVKLSGGRTEGATGPIGQVISFLTGAAVETGFNGLGGRHVRANLFSYDESLDKEGSGLAALFTRTDTGKSVKVFANPGALPMTDDEIAGAQLMPQVIGGGATKEEADHFYRYWQGKNRKILTEDHPGVFTLKQIA